MVVVAATLVVACHGKKREQPSVTVAAASAEPVPRHAALVAAVDTRAFPAALGEMKIPANNPQTDAKIALGHQLFFDERLSVDGSRSCYSCHTNEHGTGGHLPTAVGAKDKALTRHSPVLWNVGYLPAYYWDGRANSLEAQALAAWAGGNMGVGKDGLAAKAHEIGNIPTYRGRFQQAFGTPGASPEKVVQAISAYERTLVCSDSAYDRYARGDKQALTSQQKLGLGLFVGAAGCSTCHTPPHFSLAYTTAGGAYFNTGRGTEGKQTADVDPGRAQVTGQDRDWAAFKVPTLRNVAKSGPYFHDGSAKTLEEAVRFMASGGTPNKNHTPLLRDRNLSDEQIAQIVAFLGALDCPGELEPPRAPTD